MATKKTTKPTPKAAKAETPAKAAKTKRATAKSDLAAAPVATPDQPTTPATPVADATPVTPPTTAKAAKKAKAKREAGLSMLDAAAQVLATASDPMDCQALIGAMAGKGLWASPAGKTPSATLSAALHREIKVKGANSRFQKVGRGQFALAAAK